MNSDLINKYIVVSENRVLLVKSVMIEKEVCIAKEINKKDAQNEEIPFNEIIHVIDEICKNVTVE